MLGTKAWVVVMARWCGCAFLVLASFAGTVHARSTPRVGILRFVGKGEVDVRIAVTREVGMHGFTLVGAQTLEESSGAGGKPVPAAQLSELATDLNLAAVIDGRVELQRGLGTAKIAIRNPRDGSVVRVESWSVRKASSSALARAVAKDFWRKLGPTLEEISGHRVKKRVLSARRSRRHR